MFGKLNDSQILLPKLKNNKTLEKKEVKSFFCSL